MKKVSGEVGIKCHQSCTVALVFCTKLYIKLAVSLGFYFYFFFINIWGIPQQDIGLPWSSSFSQFSFLFNFRMANALVLKFGTLPLSCRFSNTLLANFDILFRSRVIHRFVPKNEPKLTCGRFFQHINKLYFKSEFKKSRASFVSSQILLAEETKIMSTTEFFVFQQSFYWTRRFDPETRAFFGYTSKLSKQIHLYFFVALSRCCYASPEIVLKKC